MKKLILISVFFSLLFLFYSFALAEVPQMMNYQGKLNRESGGPFNGIIQMVFFIYEDSTGTNLLWTETQHSVVVDKGIFNVLLGSVNPIPYSAFDGNIRYLGVKVGDDPEMTPRKPIVSVAYAYKSFEADTADYARLAPATDSARVAANAHRLQGKDTTDLDSRYVNEGQVNSVLTEMIQNEAVTTDKIQDATIVNGDIAINAGITDTKLSGTGILITDFNADLLDGQHASNFLSTENDYGRSGVAADLYEGTNTLTSKYVDEGQPSSINSAMIQDVTIQREDVASNFKAPYSDTADYARAFPGTVENADKVDGLHASSTPTSGYLYPLDGSAKIPNDRLYTGSGNGLDADLLDGQDASAFAPIVHNHDADYVNEGQPNAVNSGMITDDQIVDADISASANIAPSKISGTAWTSNNDGSGSGLDADLLDGEHASAFLTPANDYGRSGVAENLYEGASTLSSRYVNEGQENSVNSGMIQDSTIVRDDVAPDFKAPYSDTADYADVTDSARVSANAHMLQGKDTTAFDERYVNVGDSAGGDLSGIYPNPTIASGSVTSDKILDSTIVRADVAPNFKAPYSDTADYARAFPGTVENADKVDGLHASSTPTAGYLYPLDDSAKIPNSVLYTGSGLGLDADMLDGKHSSNFLSDSTDFGRLGVATDLYEGATKLTDKYVNTTGPDSLVSNSGVLRAFKVVHNNGGIALDAQSTSSGRPAFGVQASASSTGGATGGLFTSAVGVSDHYSTGVKGEATGTSHYAVWGMFGEARNYSDGMACGGQFEAESYEGFGRQFGVRGLSWSYSPSESYGVYGIAENDSSGDAYGGYFWTSFNGTGNHYGVYGWASASPTGDAYGGYFFCTNVGTGTQYGIRAVAAGGSTNYGVYALAPEGSASYAGYFQGNLVATGTKSAAVNIDNGEYRSLYCLESPENWFEDFGKGQLENGVAKINIDPLYAQTVNTSTEYYVFPIPEGDCNGLFVTNKTPISFEIKELQGGTSNIPVSYRIVAKRKGYENLRLEKTLGPTPEEETAEQLKHQAEFEQERERMEQERRRMEEERARMQGVK